MTYNDIVLDHFTNPRNVGALDKSDPGVGTGTTGAPEEGVAMRIQVRVTAPTGRIEEARFKTFGCGWAIAACSFVTEWAKGRTVDEARREADAAIVDGLHLPPDKRRYAALAAEALRAAAEDWRTRSRALEDRPPMPDARHPDR